MRKSVMVVALILMTVSAFGQPMENGQWLHSLWQASQRALGGTATGVGDAIDAGTYSGFVWAMEQMGQDQDWFLVPLSSSAGQWEAIVGKYLEAHPEEWNLHADALVYKALVAVWPGKRKPL